MKKFIVAIFFSALIFTAGICQAANIPISQAFGKNGIAFGDWYDTNGNLVLKIGNDYTINGAKIISVDFEGDTVAFYKFQLQGGNDIELQTFGNYDGEHAMLVLDEEKVLRRTQEPKYFESIGGIYLGMSKSQVMSIYGEPLGVENQPVQKISIWTYNGFELIFQYDVVSSITIYGRGDRRFDLSGLSASSSKEDFERKYESKFSGRGNLNIGHGEIITLRDGRATLQFLTPGFVF